MNIIEAVKSGKKFKRKGQREGEYRFPDYQGERALTDQDILADDWEIEEEKITISMTKSEFWEHVSSSLKEYMASKKIIPAGSPQDLLYKVSDASIGILAEKLGFK